MLPHPLACAQACKLGSTDDLGPGWMTWRKLERAPQFRLPLPSCLNYLICGFEYVWVGRAASSGLLRRWHRQTLNDLSKVTWHLHGGAENRIQMSQFQVPWSPPSFICRQQDHQLSFPPRCPLKYPHCIVQDHEYTCISETKLGCCISISIWSCEQFPLENHYLAVVG